MKFAKTYLLLGCIISCFIAKSGGAPITADTAVSAVKGWLQSDPVSLGEHLGNKVQSVDTYTDKAGLPLYHVVNLKPSGFVIVSGDDQVEPIIAFVREGQYDSSNKNPLGALIGKDLPARMARVRENGFKRGSGELKAQNKWQILGAKGSSGIQPAGINSSSVDDLRVSPFVQSLWNQYTVNNAPNGAACYNFFTPPYGAGNSNNYVCGCVATSLAQLMDYFQYPTVGVGTATFVVLVDGVSITMPLRGGDGYGDPYNWSEMLLNPINGATLAQREAIGSLTYDAGVAVNMQYTAGDSGATMVAARTALTSTFMFANAISADSASLNVGYDLTDMINPNMDARLPVLLGIVDTSGNGHCVTVDGYGYSLATSYYHLNMGWGSDDNAWYNLPIIITGDNGTFLTIEDCLYNVYTNGTGEIISGRVLNTSTNPVAGATVTATGGGVYTTTTDTNGIYALTCLPSSSSYSITVTENGYFPATGNYNTGVSVNEATSPGNVWGANFTLTPVLGPPTITTQPANQSIVVGQNATFSVAATSQSPLYYQWQTQPTSGSPAWVNLSDGAGYSGSATANLTVIDPPLTNNGEPFQCIVSNSSGAVISSPATLNVSAPPYLTISTLAGTPGVTGSTDAMNAAIEFDDPMGIAVDANTNVYVADLDNDVIRQLHLSGTNWVSTTIAGTAGVGGSIDGTNALFEGPHGIAVDAAGNVYVSDTGNSTIRMLTYAGGVWTVKTIAGLAGVTGNTNGIGSGTLFRYPMGLTVDSGGNIYVADEGNSQIRKLSPSGGNWYGTTLAGLAGTSGSADGIGTSATFYGPSGITVDTSGNLYVADTKNNTIRELTSNGGNWNVATIAGRPNQTGSTDGVGSAALFYNPTGIAIDPSGDLYVVDSGNDTIRRVTADGTNWSVFTSAGVADHTGTTDGTGTNVMFNGPSDIAVDAYTNVYISDSFNGTIRGTPLFATMTPSVLQLSKLNNSSPAFMLSWTAAVGHIYQVQYKTNMNSGVWNVLTNITTSNWTGLTSVPIGPDPQRFYRVVQLH